MPFTACNAPLRAMTLADAAKLSSAPLRRGILDQLLTDSLLLGRMPFTASSDRSVTWGATTELPNPHLPNPPSIPNPPNLSPPQAEPVNQWEGLEDYL